MYSISIYSISLTTVDVSVFHPQICPFSNLFPVKDVLGRTVEVDFWSMNLFEVTELSLLMPDITFSFSLLTNGVE